MNPSRPARLGLLALLLAGAASGGAEAAADQLRPWRWHARLLLMFAPSAENADLRRQRAWLARDAAGMFERDLVPLEIIGGSASDARVDGAALRASLHVPPDRFTAILVGKDGSEKRSAHAPLSPASLFATIDAMPMRQQEMRRAAQRPAS